MNEEITLKEGHYYDKYGNWIPKKAMEQGDYNDEQYWSTNKIVWIDRTNKEARNKHL